MAALLKDALAPNLVQTLEHTPALIHGGPFANIAHGCSSVLATTAALRMADYVVTEAGFGADLGAEKFINIKCRKAELEPAAAVLVATVRALKYHGGADLKSLSQKNLVALKKGIPNIERHALNIRNHYGLSCVVAINHRTEDSDEEITLLMDELAQKGFKVILARHWSEGGKGATELANEVVRMCEETSHFKFLYQDSDSIWDKMKAIATKIYGASDISANAKVRGEIQKLQELYGHYPVCVAKTQYSFSTDPSLLGAPTNHGVNIREVRLAAGAEFIVVVTGDIMTMPGLPEHPSANSRKLNEQNQIEGLF
jgi:formate--tetrahydrofolate ligase